MKATRREIDERIGKIQRLLSQIENGYYCGSYHPEIKKALYYFTNVYFRLPEYERQEIKKSWDEHCRSAEMISINDLALYLVGVNPFDETTRPSSFDPLIWDNAEWAIWYRQLEKTLSELQTPEEAEWAQVTGGESW